MLYFSTLDYFKQFRNNINYVAKSYTIISPAPDPPLAAQLLYRRVENFFCVQNFYQTPVPVSKIHGSRDVVSTTECSLVEVD
jgi:hypothetical protein